MRLPVFAVIAPVVSSIVLWLVLGNPAVLLFALLGPLMAVGSYLDARRTSRQMHAQREADRELEQARREHAQRTELLGRREDALAEHPPVTWFVRDGAGIPPRWAHAVVPEHRQLRLGVDVLTRMPVVADIAGGLAIVGSGVLAESVERAITAGLGWYFNENVCTVQTFTAHHSTAAGLTGTVSGATSISTYAERGMVPSNASLILRVQPDGTAVLTDFRLLSTVTTMLEVDLLTKPEAALLQQRIEATRAELGLSALPSLALTDSTSALNLAELDLVTHGPHAVLAGMTGSGKTEFLVSWLSAMAERSTPDHLNILLLDYKGGVGLGRLVSFPHVVGLISDLTPALAQRVLTSLRAEIRQRERVLAEHAVHDVALLAPSVLARLIVVIDEFRALLEATPDAGAVFADLASRGRALGMHLVLSTQQLSGVSESILANCGLRLGFRMTSPHDARVLFGGDAASALPGETGSALVAGTGLEAAVMSFEMTDARHVARITHAAREWVAAHPDWAARTPWRQPLPAALTQLPEDLVAAHDPRTSLALTFGLSDLPHEQRQELAVWEPSHDGHLHVQGGLGSGRTAALRTIAVAARDRGLMVLELGTSEQLWDAVVGTGLPLGLAPVLMVIDDLDVLVSEFSVEHREAFLAALQLRLRTAPAAQSWFVMGTLDHGSTCSWLNQLVRTSLELAQPTRGNAPGLTTWHGHETRVLLRPVAGERDLIEPSGDLLSPVHPLWLPGQSYLVITHRVRQVIRSLAEKGLPLGAVHDVGLPISVEQHNPAQPRIYVGDTESWQANYTLLGQLRQEATIIFDGCTPSEVRSLRLHRGLLPHGEPGHALAVTPDGEIHRIELVTERGFMGEASRAA